MISPAISLFCGARVELLAELHDVDLRLAKRGAYGGRGRSFAGFNLQLHIPSNFLRRCHVGSFGTSF